MYRFQGLYPAPLSRMELRDAQGDNKMIREARSMEAVLSERKSDGSVIEN